MKKLFIISILCVACIAVNAQKPVLEAGAKKHTTGNFNSFNNIDTEIAVSSPHFRSTTLQPGAFTLPCGTIPGGLTLYTDDYDQILSGTNFYGDVKFGYVFQGNSGAVSSVEAYLVRTWNGDVENIRAELYAIGTDGLPTTLLGTSLPVSTATIPLSTSSLIHTLTTFTFTADVNVPATFAAVITVPEYAANSSDIAISITELGCIIAGDERKAISYNLSDGWDSMMDVWGIPTDYMFDLAIFPILSSGNPNVMTFAPVANAINVELDAEISITFDIDITANDLSGITINGVAATATISGKKLIISHDGLEYETTYVIAVPANAINDYDQAITWSFATEEEESIFTISKNKFSIYPNPTTGNVTIDMINFAKVEIYNTVGQLIEVKTTETVNISSYNSGIYFFKIFDTDNNTATSRIVVTK